MKRFIFALVSAITLSCAALAAAPTVGEKGSVSFYCTKASDVRAAIDAVRANNADAMRALIADGSCISTQMAGVGGLPVTVVAIVGEYNGYVVIEIKFSDGSVAYALANKD